MMPRGDADTCVRAGASCSRFWQLLVTLGGVTDDERQGPFQHLLAGDTDGEFLSRIYTAKGFEGSAFQSKVVDVCKLGL
jgi:hypothetical protein